MFLNKRIFLNGKVVFIGKGREMERGERRAHVQNKRFAKRKGEG